MKKARPWIAAISFLIAVVAWGIMGLKLYDGDYNITIEAHITEACIIVLLVCVISKVFTDNEVDSVHLGMVYYAYTNREDISCLEANKLTGDWFTVKQMAEARNNGHMESWSALCFDKLLAKEEEE